MFNPATEQIMKKRIFYKIKYNNFGKLQIIHFYLFTKNKSPAIITISDNFRLNFVVIFLRARLYYPAKPNNILLLRQ